MQPTFAGNVSGSYSMALSTPFGQPSAFDAPAAKNPFQTTGSSTTDTVKNSFLQPTPAAPAKNPFQMTAASTPPAMNPFLALAPKATGFGAPPIFGAPSEGNTAFALPTAPAAFGAAKTPFGGASGSILKPTAPAFGSTSTNNSFGSQNAFGTNTTGNSFGSNTTSNTFGNTSFSAFGNKDTGTVFQSQKRPSPAPQAKKSTVNPMKIIKKRQANVNLGANAEPMDINNPYSQKIYQQLQRDRIFPPKWPHDPGNPSNKGAMATFREQYKTYRDKARASLVKAGLVDDPDTRRKLSEAIEFKGICEDMCPDYEKMIRITEYDVKSAEKDPDTGIPQTALMVKKLARSAAGQEAPLPMDVRSVAAIRRSVDYLLDDLMQTEENLPATHGFLWDRTRAIRRDFAFFSSLSKGEMLDQIYCLETVTRFHATALHLMSKPGFAPEDFSEQQEVEQLGKSLLSLIYAYDDCRAQNITCINEAEFRAYYLVLRAFDTNILDVLESEWNIGSLIDSHEIQTALAILQSLKTPRDARGPISHGPGSVTGPFAGFFDIISEPEVSFTMACFAEVHFCRYRRAVLRGLNKAFARPRGHAKDITADVINGHLRFDTVEECIEFVELHGLTFTPDVSSAASQGSRILCPQYGHQLEHPRLKNSFSQNIVDKKRGDHDLPHLIRHAVFEPGFVRDRTPINSALVSQKLAALKEKNTFGSQAPANAPTVNPPIAPTSFGGFASQQPASATFPSQPSAPPAPSSTSFSSPLAPSQQPPASQVALPQPSTTNNASSVLSQSLVPNSLMPTFSFLKPATPSPLSNIAGQQSLPAASKPASVFTPAPTATPPKKGLATAANILTSTFGSPSISTSTPNKAAASVMNTAAPTTNSRVPSFSFTQPAKPAVPAPSILSGASSTSTVAVNPFAPTISVAPAPTSAAPVAALSFTFMQTAAAPASVPVASDVPAAPVPNISSLAPASKLAAYSGSSLEPAPKKPVDRKAVLDGVAKWYTLGDEGLVQQFISYCAEDLIRQIYNDYVENMRREKEEREATENLAKADKFRMYNLSVRYFYMWRRNAKEKRLEALRRQGREELREFMQKELMKKRKETALKRKAGYREADQEVESEDVRTFKEITLKNQKNLLDGDSVMLNGYGSLDDIRGSAARMSREDDVGSAWSVPDASDPNVTKKKKKKSKKTAPTQDAVAMPAPPLPQTRRSESVSSTLSAGGKTQSLLEQYAMSRSTSLHRSLPVSSGFGASQFNRTQFSSPPVDPPAQEKRISKVSDRWRLKAMGLTTMPDGSVLPERIAQQKLYGNGSSGAPTSTGKMAQMSTTRGRRVSAADYDARISRARTLVSGTKEVTRVASAGEIKEDGELRSRKRSAEEADVDSSGISETRRILIEARRAREEIGRAMQDLREGADWLKEESGQMSMSSGRRR